MPMNVPTPSISDDPKPGGGSAAPAVVDVADGTGRCAEADIAWVKSKLEAAMHVLDVRGTLRVRIVGDDEMAKAHAEFLEIDGTTDVLTFDLREDPLDPVLDVDILACLDEATRQATRRGHEPRAEILLYGVHGLLHCLGHDDHDEAAAARMHAEEDRVLTRLGLGAVYAREERGA